MEFALISPLVLVLAFGLIDFSREIFQQQVITGLTRDGSSMAARATSIDPSQTGNVFSVLQNTSPLNLSTNGLIIITAVANNGTATTPNYQVVAQYKSGSLTATSKVAPSSAAGSAATIPTLPGGQAIAQPSQTVYVTEIFYAYTPLTPVWTVLSRLFQSQLLAPAQLYDVAYI